MIIRGHDLQNHTVEQFETLRQLYGITGYQLAIKKSFAIDDDYLSKQAIEAIDSQVFINTKILGAYFNPVHPDKAVVKAGIENFIFNMKLAEKYGIKFVGSETGSVLGSPWDYHPDNHLDQTIKQSILAFKEIADRTQGIDVQIAIEPAYHHVIKDVDALNRMNEEINDSRIVYIFDLYNLLNSRPYEDYKVVLDKFLEKASSNTKIVHLKDFMIVNNEVEQVKIGAGIVDFEYLIKKVKDNIEEPLFVLEGTLEEDLTDVSKLILKYLE